MIERSFFDFPPPVPNPLPALSALPVSVDESLLHRAWTQSRDSSEGLRQLYAGVPPVRDTLNRLLRQALDLDGEQSGLLFHPSGGHPERFVSFTAACAFVFQHPRLEEWLDLQCRVTGLPPAHALQGLTPLQLLARLKDLEPAKALDEHWNAYWDARAPGTPVSRRERTAQLYREHFEASVQIAFARRTLDAEQLKPLSLLVDSSVAALRLDNQPVNTEQLTLILSDNSKVEHPAAWVISVGDKQPVTQLLYLPCHCDVIKVFSQRSDMENWLARQSLVPTGLPIDNIRFEYTARTLPLTVGITDTLSHQQRAQLARLRNGTHGQPGLAEHGAHALNDVDRIEQQCHGSVFFASPPNLEQNDSSNDDIDDEEPSLFGSLYADIPWPVRQRSLNRQRDALETWLGDDLESDRQRNFKNSLDALEAAEQAADTAGRALLYRQRVLDLATFNREFTALYNAHKTGLHAEAELQRALKQLSEDEYSLLKALPAAAAPDQIVASLVLSMTEKNGEHTTVTTQELNGPFVITRSSALLDPASPHSLLLYWPGTGGGLQRFPSRRELERQVFKIRDQDDHLALQLKKIDADPLDYSLDRQITDFEETAGQIRQRYSDASQSAQRADELERLRKQALATLQVPLHAARHLAFAHLLEQNRSATLAASLPDWLTRAGGSERIELKALIEAYIPAMHRSHEQLEMALIPRDKFTRQHLHARLRKDFSIKGHFAVQLDLPDSVSWQKRSTPAPGAPGTAQKLFLVPSAARSKMSLQDLAQHNIDNTPSMSLEPLLLRLSYMKVEVTTEDESERKALTTGITLPYLRKILPELDLPQAYEKLILKAFIGSTDESTFVKDHRRECLIEPWRLMLKLQGACAHLQKQINYDELQVLNIAIDADTQEAWRADRKRIVLWPAHLAVGGKDTPQEGPVTLSGVTFIEEQISGMTLLYLPDSPDSRFLRRYDNLEAARKALFNLCQRDEMVSYLAGRALQGNVRAHVSRIDQAMLRHFDAMIGIGMRWPSTMSLASHLLNAHMGRLIEAHRGTSRSNDALYLERYTLNGPRAFNYIKMALGVVPFVGVAIALYDAWTSANQAVSAFLRGKVGDGLAEIESVLLSLIDATMDILPGISAGSSATRAARTLTRTRQLTASGTSARALHAPSKRRAMHVIQRFAGYEYEQPISLASLQPATTGIYRNVYRHADGDFIVRQGRIYQVELNKDARNWRLRGTASKSYKQPVGLDEAGDWDTYFGVYGVTFEGGGLGGGNVYGHLADTLDPIWPQAIRDRLPRWWTDQALRRHHQLTVAADDLSGRIDAQALRSNVVIKAYYDHPDHPALLRMAADKVCRDDIALATRQYQILEELRPLTHGNKLRALNEMQSHDAALVADRLQHRVVLANQRISPLLDEIDRLDVSLDALPAASINERLGLLREMRRLRVEVTGAIEEIEALMGDLNRWYELIVVRANKAKLADVVSDLNRRLNDFNLGYLKTAHRLESVKNFENASEVSWLYLQQRAWHLRVEMDRALYMQFSLSEVSASKAQRTQILSNCLDTYAKYRREMNQWTASYPQYFHMEEFEPLMAGIEAMAERARKAIDHPAPPRLAGQSNKKVFLTEDEQLLIGVENWEPRTRQRQFVLNDGRAGRQVWEQADNGKYRLLTPATSQTTPARRELAPLLADARKRLDAQPDYLAKVQDHADRNMLPVDLEHMLVSEADDLTHRARDIEALSAGDAIVGELRAKASELRARGREMRTWQSLKTRKPTDGMLDDLVRQKTVEIRKVAPLTRLRKRTDGRVDHLQEYEIWDLTQAPPKLLWYAHFHYSRAKPVFGEFEKAHLKLAEHRFLTHADNAELPYADIGKRSVALPHFENL